MTAPSSHLDATCCLVVLQLPGSLGFKLFPVWLFWVRLSEGLCILLFLGSILCNIEQYGAISCDIVQYSAGTAVIDATYSPGDFLRRGGFECC